MNRIYLSLPATMLVTFVLGSVHAFSVFLVPLESGLQLARSDVSLIYSFALLALTAAVLLGYRIYDLLPAPWLVLLTCLLAAAGLQLAARAENWWGLVAGYSLGFGFSNGVGYGFCLQLAGRVLPAIRGIAMGAVTAAYAVGSIVFARLFAWRIEAESAASALQTMALVIVVCGLLAALLLQLAGARYRQPGAPPAATPALPRRKIAQFWFAYLCSVFAGLMAIGHAAGIAIARGADTALATNAAITIGIGSAAGGFVAGWLVDRWRATRLLVGLPLLAAAALCAIALGGDAVTAVGLLSLVGFSYGSIIAVYPVAIANYFEAEAARAYGQVFTAWGCAGLLAPWSAGLIFDARGDYAAALLIAAAIAVLSAVTAAVSRLEHSG